MCFIYSLCLKVGFLVDYDMRKLGLGFDREEWKGWLMQRRMREDEGCCFLGPVGFLFFLNCC